MSCGITKNLSVCKGTTLVLPIRWGVEPVVFKTITSIQNAAEPTMSVPSHELVEGWPFAITNVKGMREINAPGVEPPPESYVQAEVVDIDTLRLLEVNTLDYTPYTSGGVIRYWTIPDLSGFVVTFVATNKKTKQVVWSYSSDSVAAGGKVVIDIPLSLVTIQIEADTTLAVADRQLEYYVRYSDSIGKVVGVCSGTIRLE